MAALSPVPSGAGAGEFVALALCLARSKGDRLVALELAKTQFRHTPRVESVMRSAVNSGGTADGNWAAGLADYRGVSAAFLESLKGISVFDTLLAGGMRRVPLRTPVRVVTLSATAAVAGEGQPRPVSRLELADAGLLNPVSASAIVVLSADVVRQSTAAAMTLVGNELRQAVSRVSDDIFLTLLSLSGSETSATGSSAAQILTDIETLLDAVFVSGGSRPFLILSPTEARKLAVKADTAGRRAFPEATVQGGSLAGVPILVSDSQPAGTATMADAASIVGDSEIVVLDTVRHATLALDDDPTAESALTNLWQANLVGLTATRWFGVEVVRDSAVARLTGVAW